MSHNYYSLSLNLLSVFNSYWSVDYTLLNILKAKALLMKTLNKQVSHSVILNVGPRTYVHRFKLPHPISTVRWNCHGESLNSRDNNNNNGNRKDYACKIKIWENINYWDDKKKDCERFGNVRGKERKRVNAPTPLKTIWSHIIQGLQWLVTIIMLTSIK